MSAAERAMAKALAYKKASVRIQATRCILRAVVDGRYFSFSSVDVDSWPAFVEYWVLTLGQAPVSLSAIFCVCQLFN